MKRLWLLLFCAACQRASQQSEQVETARDAQAARAQATAPDACVPPRAAARVKAHRDVRGLREGAQDLVARTTLEVARAGLLTLDFPEGARVSIGGGALVASSAREQDQLLVRRGALTVDLPPGAVTARSGFTLVTPCTTVQLVRGAALAANVREDGLTVLHIVAGSATLLGESSRADALLTPGTVVRVDCTRPSSRKQVAASTLDQAQHALATQVRAAKPSKLPVAHMETSLLETQRRLDDALRERDALQQDHRERVQRRDGTALTLQRELARHAVVVARLSEQRERLVEQRRAAAMDQSEELLDAKIRALLAAPAAPMPCP